MTEPGVGAARMELLTIRAQLVALGCPTTPVQANLLDRVESGVARAIAALAVSTPDSQVAQLASIAGARPRSERPRAGDLLMTIEVLLGGLSPNPCS